MRRRKINKEERITFRVDKEEKKEIENISNKNDMNVSEFVYQAVKEKMQINKLNDSQLQFINLFDIAFKKVYDTYHKQLMIVLNRCDFNTRWTLKQNDIFMQHLKIPQTKEELNFSIIGHPITEKAKELVTKDIRKMSTAKNELEDE